MVKLFSSCFYKIHTRYDKIKDPYRFLIAIIPMPLIYFSILYSIPLFIMLFGILCAMVISRIMYISGSFRKYSFREILKSSRYLRIFFKKELTSEQEKELEVKRSREIRDKKIRKILRKF